MDAVTDAAAAAAGGGGGDGVMEVAAMPCRSDNRVTFHLDRLTSATNIHCRAYI